MVIPSITNILTVELEATRVNDWPKIKVFLDDVLMHDVTVEHTLVVELTIPCQSGSHKLVIERYGKTYDNIVLNADGTIAEDQVLLLKSVKVDGIRLPDFFLLENTKFEFDDQTHVGSMYWGPNGHWSMEFETPFITHVLDKKILHEAKFGEDYKYPWAYQLGPDSVKTFGPELEDIRKRIELLDDQ